MCCICHWAVESFATCKMFFHLPDGQVGHKSGHSFHHFQFNIRHLAMFDNPQILLSQILLSRILLSQRSELLVFVWENSKMGFVSNIFQLCVREVGQIKLQTWLAESGDSSQHNIVFQINLFAQCHVSDQFICTISYFEPIYLHNIMFQTDICSVRTHQLRSSFKYKWPCTIRHGRWRGGQQNIIHQKA